MYMPLCRMCHERETRMNVQNAFEGNPEFVDLVAEKEAEQNRKQEKIEVPEIIIALNRVEKSTESSDSKVASVI